MGGVKTALSLRGFEAGPLRSPLRRPDAETTAAIERDLEATGLL
jgi:4-hydroxy-tetrahydrodipicolinate synthase/2-dehydro-3-deoxy-phosphogluconate/2-dehydro-3-deoxy-6-phosphogalactonate aldolase